jgi:hypothetical protein
LLVLFFFGSAPALTGDRTLKNLAGKFFRPPHDKVKFTSAAIPKPPAQAPSTANPKGPGRPKITTSTVNSGHKTILLPSNPSFGPKLKFKNEIQNSSKAKEPTLPKQSVLLTNNQESWGTGRPFRGDQKNPFFIKHQKFYPSVDKQIKAAEKRVSPLAEERDRAGLRGKLRKKLERKEGKPWVGKKELDKYVGKMEAKGGVEDGKLEV